MDKFTTEHIVGSLYINMVNSQLEAAKLEEENKKLKEDLKNAHVVLQQLKTNNGSDDTEAALGQPNSEG